MSIYRTSCCFCCCSMKNSATTTLSIYANVLVSVEYERKRIICFCWRPMTTKGRLRDLIRLSFLLFFVLSLLCLSLYIYFSRFFFLASFFLLAMCDCIRLLLFAVIGSSSRLTYIYIFFVLLFFLLRKLRRKRKKTRAHTRAHI